MNRMQRTIIALSAVLAAAVIATAGCSEATDALPTAPSRSDSPLEVLDVVVDISPATLVVESPGTWVTVHAEIPLSEVDAPSVALSGLPPDVIKADNRGDLVAKFERERIIAIVSPPEAVLQLTGRTTSGTDFDGSDTIVVQ
jgi:hypothetical protein